jgi:hypothetical protein
MTCSSDPDPSYNASIIALVQSVRAPFFLFFDYEFIGRISHNIYTSLPVCFLLCAPPHVVREHDCKPTGTPPSQCMPCHDSQCENHELSEHIR